MNFGYGLHQEQSQRLVMTAQMQQAMELLQCSMMELNQYLSEFVDSNPVADYQPAEYDWQQSWWQKVSTNGHRYGSPNSNPFPLEQVVPAEWSLADDVSLQLRTMKAHSYIVGIAVQLIGFLDNNGYLRETDEELSEAVGVSAEDIRRAVRCIQACEPVGIGARSLQECLRLQLQRIPVTFRDTASAIIDGHLEDVAAGRLPFIGKKLRIPVGEVQAVVDAIRRLNPRPGSGFGQTRVEMVIPEIIVEQVQGQFVVIQNDRAQPRFHVNRDYAKWLQRGDESAADYLRQQVQSAQWVARCLDQRKWTMQRVADAIVDAQRGFFEYGPAAMKPLNLAQVAERLGVHESTVSRATRGKYMLTPRGLFELKFFFSAGVQGDLGLTSAKAAKDAIARCVASEDRAQPLSDETLTKVLSQRGIRISRRTVAKYREELGILPSWRRKRYDD